MALVGRPELLFVDEPTAGMDPQARRDTWALLEELRGDGVTTVLTTHYLSNSFFFFFFFFFFLGVSD